MEHEHIINLELSPLLLYATYDRKHSFYEDVFPSERRRADGGLPYIPIERVLGIDDSINKDDKQLKLTLTKDNDKKLSR